MRSSFDPGKYSSQLTERLPSASRSLNAPGKMPIAAVLSSFHMSRPGLTIRTMWSASGRYCDGIVKPAFGGVGPQHFGQPLAARAAGRTLVALANIANHGPANLHRAGKFQGESVPV